MRGIGLHRTVYALLLVWSIFAVLAVMNGCRSWWSESQNGELLYWDDLTSLGNVSLTEDDLLKRQVPYLVVDAARSRLEVKVAGVPVREMPVQLLTTDSSAIEGFTRRWRTMRGKRANRVSGVHVYAAEDVYPESILVIVGNEIGVNPELMRRKMPSRFTVTWAGGLMLDVRTAQYDEPGDFMGRLPDYALDAVHSLFGGESLALQLRPLDAVTLYHMATEGTPVVYYPPAYLREETERSARPSVN